MRSYGALVHTPHGDAKIFCCGFTKVAGLIDAVRIKIDMGMVAGDGFAMFHAAIIRFGGQNLNPETLHSVGAEMIRPKDEKLITRLPVFPSLVPLVLDPNRTCPTES